MFLATTPCPWNELATDASLILPLNHTQTEEQHMLRPDRADNHHHQVVHLQLCLGGGLNLSLGSCGAWNSVKVSFILFFRRAVTLVTMWQVWFVVGTNTQPLLMRFNYTCASSADILKCQLWFTVYLWLVRMKKCLPMGSKSLQLRETNKNYELFEWKIHINEEQMVSCCLQCLNISLKMLIEVNSPAGSFSR